jgi:hypothetical protein
MLFSAPKPHAYYWSSVEAFVESDIAAVIGALTLSSEFAVEEPQRDAWRDEVDLLQSALRGVSGSVFFEYVVPRIGSRIDAVLVLGPAIVVVEFKVGADVVDRAAENQVWDYALDLKNFHLASRHVPIVPIVVATKAKHSDTALSVPHPDGVYPPLRTNPAGVRTLLDVIARTLTGPAVDAEAWGRAPYRPTPSIIEAAQALYANHSVDAIARNDAGENLSKTSACVEAVVEQARIAGHHAIVFITGVPGAGKTLVGLNLATKRQVTDTTHAVFLSGNGPLVKVLREALTRDELKRLRAKGHSKRKGEVAQPIKTFIQNVHHFRDDGVRDEHAAPSDHIVIFDEAQRAWNREMTSAFMARKKGKPGFNQSEPEFLIGYLDRHRDWAVVACLVGGGQEINRGEAGISAWLDAVREKYPHWRVYVSPNLADSEYTAGHALDRLKSHPGVSYDERLHLAVSMRSYRAEHLSSFIKAVLDCEVVRAREMLRQFRERYPLVMTRDLNVAKQWVRQQARGSERFGLVASSKAMRLKPHAIDIRVSVDPVHWFLNEKEDTRSSYYLEDAATEFQVQGLELDWACVTWDADLRYANGRWSYHDFRGKAWCNIGKLDNRAYLLNAYRVLLTRARQGMVLFVPKGEPSDPTRASKYYDPTFDYLSELGIPALT